MLEGVTPPMSQAVEVHLSAVRQVCRAAHDLKDALRQTKQCLNPPCTVRDLYLQSHQNTMRPQTHEAVPKTPLHSA